MGMKQFSSGQKKNICFTEVEPNVVYDPNHYFGLCPKLKPKLAVTVTNTKTTLQMKTLVAHSMGYFSHYKRAPKPKFAAKYQTFLDYFCTFRLSFNLLKTYIPQEVGKHKKTLKVLDFGFGS